MVRQSLSQIFFQVVVWIYWLIAPIPGLLMLGLYAMSHRATELVGKMPQPSINDPAHIGANDGLYQSFYWLTDQLFVATAFSLLIWITFTPFILWRCRQCWIMRNRSQAILTLLPLAVYGIGLLLLIYEPTNRLGWYFD